MLSKGHILIISVIIVSFVTVPIFAQEPCSDPDGYCMDKYGMNNPESYSSCLASIITTCEKQPKTTQVCLDISGKEISFSKYTTIEDYDLLHDLVLQGLNERDIDVGKIVVDNYKDTPQYESECNNLWKEYNQIGKESKIWRDTCPDLGEPPIADNIREMHSILNGVCRFATWIPIEESINESEKRIHIISLDKSEYYIGEEMIVSGKIIPAESSKHLSRSIYDSQGNEIQGGGGSFTVDESGEYMYRMSIGGFEPGLYTVRITVNGLMAESHFTSLGLKPGPIPVVKTDSSSYNYGDIIQVSGSLFNPERKTSIVITNPSNNIIVEDSVLPFLDGTISKSYDTSSSLWEISGQYTILISTDYQNSKMVINFTGPIPVCGEGTIEKNGQCVPDKSQITGGGCLIATAAFGSELAPQVQQLRELRDNYLLKTESGSSFMTGFNELYYSFSPGIADIERESPVFKEVVKITITPLIASLSLLNYVDMDSEGEVLGYGISLIILNVGMYVGIPIGIGLMVRRKI